jgi:cytochrome c oxidase subunit 2
MKRKFTLTAFVVVAVVGMMAGWPRVATAGVPAEAEQVVHMTAKRFEYAPNQIVLEITALDRDHGFKIPELAIRADLKSGQVTRVRIVPDRTGTFEFRCDVFCGSGHEDMAGEIIVVD